MLKRRLKLVLKIFFALCLLMVLFLVFERVRGQISLARYQRKLISQGEKLKASDFTRHVAESENGAPQAFAAINDLKSGRVLPDHYLPAMQAMGSGRARVGFREHEWVDDKVTNHWEEVAADLAQNEPALARIREALQKPVLNNALDLSLGAKLQITNLATAKSASRWFGPATQLALREGATSRAADNLVALISLPRLLAEDPTIISELVRIAMAAIARGHTWEALQADGWRDADLLRIQQTWEGQEFATAMARSLEGERIFQIAVWDQMRRSNDDAYQALYWTEEFLGDDADRPGWERGLRHLPFGEAVASFIKRQVYCRVWRFAWAHQDERHNLEQLQKLIEITRAAARQKSFSAVTQQIAAVEAETSNQGWYDNLRHPQPESIFTISSTVKRALQAETDRSMVICAIALKRHWVKNKILPQTLDGLVPEFLAVIPVDYMNGKPLKYQPATGGTFRLYSVGLNGVDDGGDATQSPEEATSNPWRRKDVVWPSAATSEEIEAYRSKQAK